jgi:hypothetical protein
MSTNVNMTPLDLGVAIETSLLSPSEGLSLSLHLGSARNCPSVPRPHSLQLRPSSARSATGRARRRRRGKPEGKGEGEREGRGK